MAGNVAEIIDQVRTSLRETGHPVSRPLVVGISGGVDSQVLTHALVNAVDESGPELVPVHIDHGLRPESSRDAERVKSICDGWGLSCQVVQVDVAAWSRELGQGQESAARHARYAALAQVAIDASTDTLVTGHTLNDQIETVMLRLISGTGLEGLSGMKELSRRPVPLAPDLPALKRFVIYRPLLKLSREEIEAYAREAGIAPIEDETNASMAYRRNAIRHTVIPDIQAIEPAAGEAIARTAALLQDDARFIADAVEKTFAEVAAERAGLWMLERQQFGGLHPAIQRRVLYRIIEPLLGQGTRLSQERIDALRSAAIEGQPGKVIELAEDVIGYVDYERVAIGRSATLEDQLRGLSWAPLVPPGTVIDLDGDVDVPLTRSWRIRGHAAAASELTLRTRTEGDRTRDKRGHELKLKDWFVDRKVPRYLRDWFPVVALDGEVRWVIGLDITEFHDRRNNIHLHLELDSTGNLGPV
ncbi:MAG: tRNA lysidine(34) synthetase TilS [Thermomicrobiaceae bacterium]